MKLLVVSHSCATPSNQDLFARVQRLTSWDMTLVLPRVWNADYGPRPAELLPGFDAKLRPTPVALNGNIPLHFYRARLSRIFTEERPDVIYVQHDPHALATMQAFRANSASVVVPIGFKNEQNIPRRYPWPISAGERSVYSKASFALIPAEAPGEALRAKGYEGPLRVIPYGVDLDLFSPGPARPEDALVVGYVGRLVPEKGVDTLIEALAGCPEEVRAVIFGSGPSERDLRDLAGLLGVAGRIDWRGYLEHSRAPEAYAEMDLLALPSKSVRGWREQFGRVVIEALACGVPVVSSDSGEPPRLIEQTKGGWTFAEGSAEQLAERLRWAREHRDDLRRTGQAGREAVERTFGADVVAEQFVEMVEVDGLGRSG